MRAVHKKAAPKQKAAKKQKTAPKKKCLQCDAAFGRADNLSRHVRTVLEQRFGGASTLRHGATSNAETTRA